MADEELKFAIQADLDDKNITKQCDEIAKTIKNKIGTAIDDSILKKLTDTENKFKTIIKSGEKYYSVIAKIGPRKGIGVSKSDISGPFSTNEALQIYESKNTYSSYKNQIDAISYDRLKKTIKEQDNYNNKLKEFKNILNELKNTPIEELVELGYTKKSFNKYKNIGIDVSEALDIIDKISEYKKEQKEKSKLAEETKKLEEEQNKYNESMKEYKNLLDSKTFSSYKELKDIGSGIRSANLSASKKGLDTTAGVDAYKSYEEQDKLITENAKNLYKTLEDVIPKEDIIKYHLQSITEQMKKLEDEIIITASKGEDVKSLKEEFAKLNEEASKLKEQLKPSRFQKFVNTLKRLGIYRLGRNFYRFAEQGLSEGIKGLAGISPEVSESLNKITGSLSQIGASVAVVIVPLLKIAEPLINIITDTIGKLASAISYLGYELGLTSSWFKINTDYIKEFNKQANNLSFDKFEALSGTDDSSSMFEEVTGGTTDDIKNIALIISEIGASLLIFEGYEFFKWLKDDGLEKVKDGLIKIKDKLAGVSSATMILSSTLGFITSVTNFITLLKNWDTSSLISKITGITALLTGLASVVFTILALTAGGKVKVFNALATGLGAAAILLAGASALTVDMKANGGMVEKGSLFVAGEAGAELVTTMPSGQTGVTNISQFKQAMVEALYEWSSSQDTYGEDIVLNLDGAEIARSKRFKYEILRTCSIFLR